MKYAIISALAIGMAATTIHCKNAAAKIISPPTAGTFEPVAVIELFTSQGCSSCPPADRLLGATIEDANEKGKKIFALSFHVDYWNRLGWPDPFSTAAFTKRQSDYVSAMRLDGAYTPQMVVNGTTEFVGSEQGALARALSKALATKAEVNFTKLNMINAEGQPLKLQYALEGNFANSKINFALLSLHETTAVKKGENGGAVLKNDNVVRQLITEKAAASGEITFLQSPAPAKENSCVIAFVQEDGGHITGAAKLSSFR